MRINIIIFFFLSLPSSTSSSFFPFSFLFFSLSRKKESFYRVYFFTIWSQRSRDRAQRSVARATCGEPTNDEKIDKITYLIERVRFGSGNSPFLFFYDAHTRKKTRSLYRLESSRNCSSLGTTPSPRFNNPHWGESIFQERNSFPRYLHSWCWGKGRRGLGEEKEEEKRECDLSESSTVRQGNERTLE